MDVERTCLTCAWPVSGKHAKYCERCRSLRLKKPKGKYQFTEKMDDAITQAYLERKDVKVPGLQALANRFKMPLSQIYTRAVVLGLTRTKDRRWSKAEDDILYANSWLTPQSMKRKLSEQGFDRTETAIGNRVKRLMVKGSDPDVYTARSLADCFGVVVNVVLRWIGLGYLPALRTDGRGTYVITTRDIRRFLKKHPMEFDIRKVDQLWFMDLLMGTVGEQPTRSMNHRGQFAWQ